MFTKIKNAFAKAECFILAWYINNIARANDFVWEAYENHMNGSFSKNANPVADDEISFSNDTIKPADLYAHYLAIRDAVKSEKQSRRDMRREYARQKYAQKKVWKMLPSWEKKRIQFEHDRRMEEKEEWKRNWLQRSSQTSLEAIYSGLPSLGKLPSLFFRWTWGATFASCLASITYIFYINVDNAIYWLADLMVKSGLSFELAMGSFGIALSITLSSLAMIFIEMIPHSPEIPDLLWSLDYENQDRFSELAHTLDELSAKEAAHE